MDDEVKRIKAARTYYEVLKVTRSASGNELKKAYRKASLKVHPDKNSAPGAVQAFQAVTDAYNVLSDERKKEIYDQVGHERFVARTRSGGDAAATAGHGMHGFEGMTAEELFSMFFQGGIPRGAGGGFGPRVRVHRTQFGGGGRRGGGGFFGNDGGNGGDNRGRGEGGGGGGGGFLFGYMPLLILIAFWFLSSAFSETRAYQLHQTSSYPTRRQTTSTKYPLTYYTDGSFERRFPTPRHVFQIEVEVWRDMLQYLEQQCVYERREKSNKMYWTFGERRKQLEKELKTPSCDRFKKLREDRPRESLYS